MTAALDDAAVDQDQDLVRVRHRHQPVREREVGPGQTALVNIYTSLVPSTTKLLINFVSDDYATIGPRACGRALGDQGHATHLHTIRSGEKLTSAGMTFCGPAPIRLI